MTIQNLPLQNLISDQVQAAYTYRVLTAQYGDGYSQQAADGANNERIQVSIEYRNLNTSDANTVIAFLRGLQGYKPFYYTLTGDIKRAWRLIPDSLSVLISGVNKNTPSEFYRTVTFSATNSYDPE